MGTGSDKEEEQHAPKLSGRRKKAAKAKQAKPGSFVNMGLSIPVLKAIKRKGFQLPTPIQRKTIPLIMQGVDVVGMAMTGSGKTGAFVIPIIHKLGSHNGTTGARAVLLAPVRELALQTYKVVTEICKFTDLTSAVLVGGDSMSVQFAELSAAPDIIVATPGRLLHHLSEVPGFTLKSVNFIVLDEADRLFEMGLGSQVVDILKQTPESRQALLFSATLPSALAEFASAGLRSPQLVRLDADTKLSPTLDLQFINVREGDKPAALLILLQDLLATGSPTLVFVATKHRVEYLQLVLEQVGIPCSSVYGTMDQVARKISVAKLRVGKVSVMLVTDVAARGIDIPSIDNVINYDYPAKPKLFLHRTGRAARAGRAGTAYSLVTSEDMPYVIDTHLFLSRPLKPAPAPGQHTAAAAEEGSSSGASEKITWLGGIPEGLLGIAIEQMHSIVSANATLQGMEQTCTNSFNLYRRTKPPAATESVKRARKFPKGGPHALLYDLAVRLKVENAETDAAAGRETRAEITNALKRFRPAATVLEAQVASGRLGNASTTPAAAHKLDVMAAKRAEHQCTIAAHHSNIDEAMLDDHRLEAAEMNPGNVRVTDADALDNDAASDESASDSDAEDRVHGQQKGKHTKDSRRQKHTQDATGAPKRPLGSDDSAVQRAWVPDIVGSGGTGRFRDESFFLSAEKPDKYSEEGYAVAENGRSALAANVLDLMGEDNAGLLAEKKRKVWDNKKKRYVTLQKGEVMKAGKRVKVQQNASSSKGGNKRGKEAECGEMYKKWLKHHGGKAGKDAAAGGKKGSSAFGSRFKHGGRGWTNEFKTKRANSNIKDDLKSEGEMRKEAKKKERMRDHLKSKSKGVGKKKKRSGN